MTLTDPGGIVFPLPDNLQFIAAFSLSAAEPRGAIVEKYFHLAIGQGCHDADAEG